MSTPPRHAAPLVAVPDSLKAWLVNPGLALDDASPGCAKFSMNADCPSVEEADPDDVVCCVRWDGLLYISLDDILRILSFRLHLVGHHPERRWLSRRAVSFLRNLKIGEGATFHHTGSELLQHLYGVGSINSRRDQKVYFWVTVPHDELYLTVLEAAMRTAGHVQSAAFSLDQMLGAKAWFEYIRASWASLSSLPTPRRIVRNPGFEW
ncbi:hypothetical protein JCM10207_002623 [Rhodosporidiobolus poonsookiae]